MEADAVPMRDRDLQQQISPRPGAHDFLELGKDLKGEGQGLRLQATLGGIESMCGGAAQEGRGFLAEPLAETTKQDMTFEESLRLR